MKRLLAACMFIFGLTLAAAENYEASEVNGKALTAWLEEDFTCKIDEDGDILCKGKGTSFYVILYAERSMLCFKSSWGKPDDISVKVLKEMANEFNRDKIFVTVAVDDDGDVTVEYYMVYNGGLNRTNFTESLSWFLAIDDAWSDAVAARLD